MMKLIFKHLAVLTMILSAALGCWAQHGVNAHDERVRDRITQAVMDVYDRALTANPDDYDTRFARANQLYLNGFYDDAIADALIVLEQAPPKEKETRCDTYILLARLYDIKGDLTAEVEALRAAAQEDPKSLAVVDMMGKAALRMGDLDAAESNFRIILRDTPMNYDAHYQLALVEVARNNYGKAAEYVDQAVELFTAEPQVYINRADVLSRMGQHEAAAQDLVVAMSVGNDNGRASQALVTMSDTHYQQVMDVLADCIDKAPQVGMFRYVRATVAMRHYHYGQALYELNSIVDNNIYDYHSIYYYRALCRCELLDFDHAADDVMRAVTSAQSAGEAVPADYYLLWARVSHFRNKFDDRANEENLINLALAADSTSHDALLARARLMLDQRHDAAAIALVDEALRNWPYSAEAQLLRGWIAKYRLKNEPAARVSFERMLESDDQSAASLRGFALHELGRDDEARQWAAQMVQKGVLPGGGSYVTAAALLSDIGDYDKGDKDKALDYLRTALANGFGSRLELELNEAPYVNLKLVRRYEHFQPTLDQYKSNFEVKR